MSRNCVRLAATNGSALPSKRATAPWPANKVPDALGAIIANVMPSARLTPMATASALKAGVASNSGRATKPSVRSPLKAELSTVTDSASISVTPRPVMPPNSPGVSGRPLASMMVVPAPGGRLLPISTTRPLRTRTSLRSSMPCGVSVWTCALRISTSCAPADVQASRAMAHDNNGKRCRRFIVRLPAGPAGNRRAESPVAGCDRRRRRHRCRRGRPARRR